jgi:hypothetical protein
VPLPNVGEKDVAVGELADFSRHGVCEEIERFKPDDPVADVNPIPLVRFEHGQAQEGVRPISLTKFLHKDKMHKLAETGKGTGNYCTITVYRTDTTGTVQVLLPEAHLLLGET